MLCNLQTKIHKSDCIKIVTFYQIRAESLNHICIWSDIQKSHLLEVLLNTVNMSGLIKQLGEKTLNCKGMCGVRSCVRIHSSSFYVTNSTQRGWIGHFILPFTKSCPKILSWFSSLDNLVDQRTDIIWGTKRRLELFTFWMRTDSDKIRMK